MTVICNPDNEDECIDCDQDARCCFDDVCADCSGADFDDFDPDDCVPEEFMF